MEYFNLGLPYSYFINRAGHLLKYELLQAFKKNGCDITPEQWAVLTRLWEQDGLSQVELSDLTFKDRPVITRIIDILERKEVIIRRPDGHDRRIVRLYLTQKGKDYQEKLVPLAREVLERGQSGISEEEIQRTTSTLQKIITNLE